MKAIKIITLMFWATIIKMPIDKLNKKLARLKQIAYIC